MEDLDFKEFEDYLSQSEKMLNKKNVEAKNFALVHSLLTYLGMKHNCLDLIFYYVNDCDFGKKPKKIIITDDDTNTCEFNLKNTKILYTAIIYKNSFDSKILTNQNKKC